MHICIYLFSAFVGSVGGRPGRSTQTFVLGLHSVNKITTARKNVKAKINKGSKSRPTGSPKTPRPRVFLSLSLSSGKLLQKIQGRTSTFNLDYFLLVIAVYRWAAVWTTANSQLSGLAHCKHIIVLHTACVLFKFTCHQGPWLELCDLAGDFYSCWKLPVIHFRLCSEGTHNPLWMDGAKPGALRQLPGQVIYSNHNAKRRG